MKDSHTTAAKSSALCAAHLEFESNSPGLYAPASQRGTNRFRQAVFFSRRSLVGMLLSGLLVLSACSPSPPGSSGTTPPGTTSGATETSAITPTSTTPTPSTAAAYKPATENGAAQNVPVPVLPAKAKEFSKEGLIAFAEYWYSTLGYVYETGDSTPMMAVTEADCKTCAFINEPVGSWYESGGWIVGGNMTVLQSTSPFAETTDGAYQAMMLVRQSKVTYYASNGTKSTDHPQAIAKTNLVEAIYVNGGWTAKSAEILKRG